jgi:hypothetical protein
MDKMDHLMAEKNENNKDSQKGQVTPKNIFFLKCDFGKRLEKIISSEAAGMVIIIIIKLVFINRFPSLFAVDTFRHFEVHF